jgi:hypothetical protein
MHPPKITPVLLIASMTRDAVRQGVKPPLLRFDFNSQEAEDAAAILAEHPGSTYEELVAVIKESIALDYLSYPYMGGGLVVALTTKGAGAGHSHNQAQQLMQSKGKAKKLSDWISEHNGLTTGYAAIVGTCGLAIAIIGLLTR